LRVAVGGILTLLVLFAFFLSRLAGPVH